MAGFFFNSLKLSHADQWHALLSPHTRTSQLHASDLPPKVLNGYRQFDFFHTYCLPTAYYLFIHLISHRRTRPSAKYPGLCVRDGLIVEIEIIPTNGALTVATRDCY